MSISSKIRIVNYITPSTLTRWMHGEHAFVKELFRWTCKTSKREEVNL